MKLSSALLALVGSAFGSWEQPSYADVIKGWNQKSAGNWGHPIIGNARHWSDCPSIDTSTIEGIDGLRCNQATCALACKPGYVATGRRRAKCRKNKKTGKWFWKNKLGNCKTCEVETPMSNDPNMTTTCKVNSNTNRKFCKMMCPADHTFGGQNNKPNQKFVKIACKCPKRGNKGCNWYHKRNISNYENYTCNPKPTPAPAAEPADGTNPADNDPTFIPAGGATTAAPGATTAAAGATTAAAGATTAAAGATTAAAGATTAAAGATTAAAGATTAAAGATTAAAGATTAAAGATTAAAGATTAAAGGK
jgi:hypothetical protein